MPQPDTTLPAANDPRVVAALPFVVTATLAQLGAGILAATTAHAPNRNVLWTVAFLILVVGMAQFVLGAGQAIMRRQPPGTRSLTLQWLLFNGGSAAVIAGTICDVFPLVATGTMAFLLSLLMFHLAVRNVTQRWLLLAYQLVLAIAATGASIGLVLAWFRLAA